MSLSRLKFQVTENSPQVGTPVHSGRLSLKSRLGDFTEGSATLYEDKLVFAPLDGESPTLVTSIKWKRLLPFQDVVETVVRHVGFQIFGSQNGEDFFTESPEDLEDWLVHLYKYMIITDLDEDFDLIEKIG